MALLYLVRITDRDYQSYRKSFAKIEYSFNLKDDSEFIIPDDGKNFTDVAILKKGKFLEKIKKPGIEMYFVKDKNNEIVGVVNLEIEDNEANIETFAVFEKLHGVGREAYGQLKEMLISRGVEKVQLYCPFKGSQAFWEKMGFFEIPYIPFAYEARL